MSCFCLFLLLLASAPCLLSRLTVYRFALPPDQCCLIIAWLGGEQVDARRALRLAGVLRVRGRASHTVPSTG